MINEGDWDCLIVLDACRYDFFEEIYGKYLDGDLKKTVSPGSCTTEWLERTFQDEGFKDVSYISANPFVNSKSAVGADGLSEKFEEIIDVWDFGWDDELNTVPPKKVLDVGKEIEGRKILHFIQPHAPYIGRDSGISISSTFPLKSYPNLVHISTKIGRHLNRTIWKYLLWLNAEISILKNGMLSVLKGYKNNLRVALEETSKHTDQLGEKVIVTSDHGEAFGENGVFEHPPGQNIPVLRNVPWLEM